MIGRRRFLTIVAGAGLGLALGQSAAKASQPFYRWRGTALGAAAQIVLPRDNATELVALARSEILRLEKIFSLYRRDSALSRLNAAGRLSEPPPELLELLDLCDAAHRMTGGAFDPTIQPLWQLYAKAYTAGHAPTPVQIERVRQSTGWNLIHYSTRNVGFQGTGCALSLNGIAQGYITDKVALLLRAAGLSNVLVDMGEIVALGQQANDEPWPIAIRSATGRAYLAQPHPSATRAVATSAPLGTTFDAAGRVGHLLDPRTGRPTEASRTITVIGPMAAMADGLSTGLCINPETEDRDIPDDYTIIRA